MVSALICTARGSRRIDVCANITSSTVFPTIPKGGYGVCAGVVVRDLNVLYKEK
jgi:hypothetical protein